MSDQILKIFRNHDTKLDVYGKQIESNSRQLAEHGNKLDEHTKKLDLHGRKLDEHTKKLDLHGRKLDEHGKKLDEHGVKLDSHTEQLEVIASTVLDVSDRLEKVEVKIDNLPTRTRFDELMNKIDKMLKRTIDHEQEDAMMKHGIRRVGNKADNNAKDIQMIKPLVGLG